MDAKNLILACAALILTSLIPIIGLAGCLAGPGTDLPNPPGRTLYVSSSSDCGAPRPCHASIQDAVDAAREGDLIKVAQGVYTTRASHVVGIKKGIQLVGGYRIGDWSQPCSGAQHTVVDAGQVLGRRGMFIDGRGVATITVRCFRIRGGSAQASEGGGVYVAGGSVVLEDNVIEACTAETGGGGLFIADGLVHLRNNVLRSNAARYGGALHVDGGNVMLDRNTFLHNQASDMRGAIAIGGGVVTGTNDVIAQNQMAGAGVYLSGGHLTASHWTLADNGVYGVFADLRIDAQGALATLSQTIVASHQVGLGGASVTARQTLFHHVDHPCMAGASCVSNLSGDPKFIDPLAGDYHIAADSAAVDRAHGLDVLSDMDGDTRPVGMASDIGADEAGPQRAYLPFVARHSGAHRR